MSNERLRLQLGELINATRGLVDLLADEQIEPASSPPAPWPPRWPGDTTLAERLGYHLHPEVDPATFGRMTSQRREPPMTVDAKRLDLDAALMRLRFELDAERRGRESADGMIARLTETLAQARGEREAAQRGHMATTAELAATRAQQEGTEAHRRTLSGELAEAHALIASLETTVTELRDQRTAATRRVAELTEQINGTSVIVDLNGGPDWRAYDVELDANGEPPRIVNGTLSGRWRANDGEPGGEVWVRYTPGDMDHPGTGSRYVVTLPISPPDGPPRFVPGADRTDPED